MKFIYFILRKIGNAGPRFKHLNRVNFILKGKIHSLRIQLKMMDVYAPCYIRTNARRVELKFIIRAPFRLKKKQNIDTVAIFGRRTENHLVCSSPSAT